MMWLLVFIIMLLVVAGMAVGVMLGRKPIAGSCGGIANLGIERDECPICGGNSAKCEEANNQSPNRTTTVAVYDASRTSS